MRNHHHHQQQQQLLLSLATLKCFIIIFTALLLINGQLPKGEGASMSCYTESSSGTCPKLNNTSLFPFLSSQACAGSASSFLISGCELSNSEMKPRWPNFVNATLNNATLGPPYVLSLDNPFQIPPPHQHTNSSNLPNSLNASQNVAPIKPSSFGLINLTWSQTLINKAVCEIGAPLTQILSQYLPQTIDLTSFAHSAFQFTPSNIILLFNCNSSYPSSQYVQKNSTACRSYGNQCGLGDEEISNCYQYTPWKELNLPQAMKTRGCENAMFFVVSQQASTPVWKWSPGVLQLNWSTHDNPWISETLNLCEGCLQSSGSCGYNGDYNGEDLFQCYCANNFQCYCANNTDSSTNCTITADKIHKDCSTFKCHLGMNIGFGAVGFAVALSLAVLFCICKRKIFMKTSIPCSSQHSNKSWMKKPSFLSRKQDPILAKEMSYQEIVHATESFAETHMLGDGGFGAVYKGVLADGRKVAVKRLYHDNYRRIEHFYNEIKVLSNLNHPNLVKLYGFCCEDDRELLLVFEYAPQGTVSDHLHNASKPPMSWNLRLDIACETADALFYLHNSVIPPIYHRDVKTTNILLDEGLHAKLADFGLSKFVPLRATHVSTAPQGTPGYLDPDYHQCYQLTDKSDVYSLGVVLMELVSAKLAVDMSRERGEINLSTLAVMKIKCGQLEELVDPTLEMKKNPCVERSINRVVELAFQCLHAERDERPSMSFVAKTLIEIRREHAQNEDGDGEDLANTQTSTHSTPTTCQSCVSNEPNKPFQHSQDSPCSVFFSSGSSNRSISF